jgi:hypothetical protein
MPNALADLMEATDSTRRKIQFWVEAGAIMPEPGTDRGGRGVHREFSTEELVIACVLKAIEGDHVVPIGRLLAISKNLRSQLSIKAVMEEINEAIMGRLDLFMVISPRQGSSYTSIGWFLIANSRTTMPDPPNYDVGAFLRTYLVDGLIADNRRDNCSRNIIYLNPWLSKVRQILR